MNIGQETPFTENEVVSVWLGHRSNKKDYGEDRLA